MILVGTILRIFLDGANNRAKKNAACSAPEASKDDSSFTGPVQFALDEAEYLMPHFPQRACATG